MGIKVLLADDSATIKKVMQLSLQDFAVELKAVSSGEDVLEVARKFRPDIAFVDVLLPQKSGYELASAFKKDDVLRKTPVIVLWSSFMDFDEQKYKNSGADEKLEKPFEAATLRQLIHKYIPKTVESPIAKHLEFPVFEFDSMTGSVAKGAKPGFELPQPPPLPQAPPKSEWSMESFEDIAQFAKKEESDNAMTVPLPAVAPQPLPSQAKPPPKAPPPEEGGEGEWVRKDLNKFKVPIANENSEEGAVSFQYSESQIANSDFLLKPNKNPPPAQAPAEERLLPHAATPQVKPEDLQSIVSTEIEKLVREQARQIVEKIVWKVVPDIASNIIKEEINRLLKEQS